MQESLKRRTISSLIWKFMERAGNQVVLLIVQIVMARVLSPDDFGFLAIVLVFINLATVFVQSGLGAALVQNPTMSNEDCSTVFWISLGISVILVAMLFFAAPAIAAFYSNDLLSWPLRVLSVTLIINSFNSVQVARVQRGLQFKKIFNATAWSVCVSGALGIMAAVFGAGIWALVLQQLIYQLVNCVVLAVQERWAPCLRFNAKRGKELFDFGWKILACNILNQGYLGIYDLVIGAQFSAGQLGLVSQGKKYPSALGGMLDGAIQPVMMSAISRIQTEIEQAKRLTRRALKTSTFVIVPCMTLFAVAAQPIVSILLGEKWLECVPFLQMYCFVYALLPIHSSNLSALSGLGRSDINLKLEIIKKCIGMLALVIGAFVVHDVYVLVSMAMLTGIISTVINAWPNRKVIGYSYLEQIKDICPAFVLSAASAAVAFPIGMLALPDIATILLQAAVMAACYLGLSKLFRVEALGYLLSTAKEVVVLRRG